MTENDKRRSIDEILRRLDVARELLPEYFRKFLPPEAVEHGPKEPEGQAWQWLAAVLVSDDEIFGRIEHLRSPKRRGPKKKRPEEAKHPPELLVQLAEAFDKFARHQRHDAARIGIPKPSQAQMVVSFRTKVGESFTWLPESDQTALKLVQDGRRIRKWPRVVIKGRWRIFHPIQASAYQALRRAPLLTDQETVHAEDEICALRYDRDGDVKRMSDLFLIHTMRAHAIQSLNGGPPLPLLKRVAEEIRDE